MNLDFNRIKLIKGDASFRKYYRKINKKKTSIIVYSKKEKIKNLLNYDSINKILIKKNISAPKLLSENFQNHFIEIEDLGPNTLFDILKRKKRKIEIYKKILKILIRLQSVKIRKIKNFKGKFYKIPIYKNKLIFDEANLFLRWYVPEVLNKNKKNKINNQFKKIIHFLIKKIKLKNNTFVHRDFHVSNLMLKKKVISIIDSQDAVYGNPAYDLASLIDDVRFKTSKKNKKIIYQNYLYLNKNNFNIQSFRNDFEILSVLRNLKIIGIFTRLAIRDKKTIYLKLIPYAWKLIESRLDNNPIFIDLKKYLNINFSKKIRNKK